MAKSLKENKYIARIEDMRGTKGWQLRLPRWHPMYPYTEMFSDSVFEGTESALLAAKKRRDTFIAKQGYALSVNRHSRKKLGEPGVMGLSLAQDARRLPKIVWYWAVYWSPEGRQVRRVISLKKLGFSKALSKAVQLREKALGQEYDDEELLQTALLGFLKISDSLNRLNVDVKTQQAFLR